MPTKRKIIIQYSRAYYLQNLLNDIFGLTSISIDENQIVLGSGELFNKCSYRGAGVENFRKLFWSALVYKFEFFDVAGISKNNYNYDAMVANTRKYFKKNNVQFKFLEGTRFDNSQIPKLMAIYINSYILPAIFYDGINKEKENLKDDIIELEINNAFERVREMITLEYIRYSGNTESSKVYIVRDSEYYESEYNFAVPLLISEISDVVKIYPVESRIYVYRESQSKQESMEDDLFTQITNQYKKYPLDEIDTYCWNIEYNNNSNLNDMGESYQLSNIEIPNYLLQQQKCYYLTLVNRDIINSYCVNSVQAWNEIIKENAKQDFLKENKVRLKKYYLEVIKYIEDCLKRIFSINFGRYIYGTIKDMEEFMDYLNMDSKSIINFLSIDKADIEWITLQAYLIIQRVIQDVKQLLEQNAITLNKAYKEYLDSSTICDHKKEIEKFVNSDNLINALKYQEDYVLQFPQYFKKANTPEEIWSKYKSRHLFKKLRGALIDYYELLIP